MAIRRLGGQALLGAAVAALALSLVPWSAEAASPCAPGQPPGRPPGHPPGRPGQPPGRPPQYPPGQCQLRLSAAAAAPGETVTATGDGYAAGSAVQFSVAGQRMRSATADSSGGVTAALTVPADAPPGATQVVASGVDPAGGAYVLSGAFTVLPDGADGGAQSAESAWSASSSSLVATGAARTAPLVATGAGLVAIGVAATLVGRRRRPDQSR